MLRVSAVALMSSLLIAPLMMVRPMVAESAPLLMPLPTKITQGTGFFALDKGYTVRINGGGELSHAALTRFEKSIERKTQAVASEKSAKKIALEIVVGADVPSLVGAEEGYKLSITDKGARIEAANNQGLTHALATLRQLTIEGRNGWGWPAVEIADEPTFHWRGLMIDPSRHFLPVDVVKRTLDAMEFTKLNVLHFHLSDNEGFRLESKALPLLTEKGSNGQFYTQAEMKDLIDYAAKRGIEVVPEFDMPAHSQSWFAGYPEISSSKGNFKAGPISYEGANANTTLADLNYFENHGGIPAMDPTNEATYQLLDKLIAEVAALFPSPYLHIGADENNGVIWTNNPEIVAFMKAHNLADAPALQAYFVARVKELVEKHGKKMAAWEEAYAGEKSSDTLFEVWSMEPKSDLTKVPMTRGNHIIIANGFYLDIYFPAYTHYLNPIMPADAKAANAPWGGEGAIWTEMVEPANFDARVWPRMGVVAERLWTGGTSLDVDAMYPRMFALTKQLDSEGLHVTSNYKEHVKAIAGAKSPAPVETLLATLAPLTGYQRNAAQVLRFMKANTWPVPLDQVADFLPMDTESRYRFRMVLAEYLKTNSKTAEAGVRGWLKVWAGEEAALKLYLGQSAAFDAVAPHAKTLSALATAALKALDSYDRGADLSPEEKQAAEALLKSSRDKIGETQLALTPEFQALFTKKLADYSAKPPIEE